MIDDVMSAPPFTLFPSSFLHRSFLLLSPVREVVILHELNIAPEAHNPRASLSRLLLSLSPFLSFAFFFPSPSSPLLPPVVNLSPLLRHSQTAHPPPSPLSLSTFSRTISIRYLSVIPALLGSSFRCLPLQQLHERHASSGILETGKCPVPRELCVGWGPTRHGHNPPFDASSTLSALRRRITRTCHGIALPILDLRYFCTFQ